MTHNRTMFASRYKDKSWPKVRVKRKMNYFHGHNKKRAFPKESSFKSIWIVMDYLFKAWATSTAHATVQPTMGLLPIPRNPIISTWAGTDEEPANWASECIRPIVSVIPYEQQPCYWGETFYSAEYQTEIYSCLFQRTFNFTYRLHHRQKTHEY